MKYNIMFATGNQDKMREIREILEGLDAEILSMKEAGILLDIEENGTTFEENALIKAKAIANNVNESAFSSGSRRGVIVMADDSGLEIDYLNKEPGVYSARYMGENTSYRVKNQELLRRLRGVSKPQRSARFVCAIAAVFPDGKTIVKRGTIEGYIGEEPAGKNGFGYDPIFYVEQYNASLAEISREEKNALSHRGNALRAIKKELERDFF